MLTVVYVLVSSERDMYYEQALLSLYSFRMYNPDMNAVVLVDDLTEATLRGKRGKIREYASEIRVIEVPKGYSPKERSRFIKTTFRKYLSGNLLFVDTDTIISGNLSDVENSDAEIAAVLDYHAPLDRLIDGQKIRCRIKNIFGEDISDEKFYYNSGVMFMRDTLSVHQLFNEWHEYWKISAFSQGQCYDQPALLMADRKCGHIIKELDGIYNCQILTSIQYLHHGRIIHFFNNVWEGKAAFSPFFQDQLYKNIKDAGDIAESTHKLVADCKAAFFSPTYYTSSEQVKFFSTLVGATCYSLYRRQNLLYKILEGLCSIKFFIADKLSHKH